MIRDQNISGVSLTGFFLLSGARTQALTGVKNLDRYSIGISVSNGGH